MHPPKTYYIAFLMLLAMLVACKSTKTAKDSESNAGNAQIVAESPMEESDQAIANEYPGGEEAYDPYGGHIDWVFRMFSGRESHKYTPTKTIGKEKWTYVRFGRDIEFVFVAYQTAQSAIQWQFGLENDTLVYAEEMETFLPVDSSDWRSYTYVILKDTVVAFSAESTGDLEVKPEAEKTAELFQRWPSFQANLDQVKASLGFDGVKDQAAMEVYEDFLLGRESYLEKYSDASTPLKITISYRGKSMKDKVILLKTEAEKRQFLTKEDKPRGRSRLLSTLGNKAVFELRKSAPKVYIQELIFSDKRVLLEMKLVDILEE